MTTSSIPSHNWPLPSVVNEVFLPKLARLVSLVEPCVGRGEVGGFNDASKLQLGAYFDTELLHQGGGMVSIPEFADVSQAVMWNDNWIFDCLLVFVWSHEEMIELDFDANGMAECGSETLAGMGAIVTVRDRQDGERLYQVSSLEDGTGGGIHTDGMLFRQILCAEPRILTIEGAEVMSAGQWLSNAGMNQFPSVSTACSRFTNRL